MAKRDKWINPAYMESNKPSDRGVRVAKGLADAMSDMPLSTTGNRAYRRMCDEAERLGIPQPTRAEIDILRNLPNHKLSAQGRRLRDILNSEY